jgi:hypothetical protein
MPNLALCSIYNTSKTPVHTPPMHPYSSHCIPLHPTASHCIPTHPTASHCKPTGGRAPGQPCGWSAPAPVPPGPPAADARRWPGEPPAPPAIQAAQRQGGGGATNHGPQQSRVGSNEGEVGEERTNPMGKEPVGGGGTDQCTLLRGGCSPARLKRRNTSSRGLLAATTQGTPE